jgi:hypothetical protein
MAIHAGTALRLFRPTHCQKKQPADFCETGGLTENPVVRFLAD